MNENNDIRSKCNVKSLNVERVLCAFQSDFETYTQCTHTDNKQYAWCTVHRDRSGHN